MQTSIWAPLEFGTEEICVTKYETLLPQIWGTPFSASRGACACSRQAGVTGSELVLPRVYAVVVGHPRDDNPATAKTNRTTLQGQRRYAGFGGWSAIHSAWLGTQKYWCLWSGCKGGSLVAKGWCSNKVPLYQYFVSYKYHCRFLHKRPSQRTSL